MTSTKTVFIFFLLMVTLQSTAQKNPVLYAGFEFYRDTGFKGNSFGNFNIGSQLYKWKFIAPEIGFHYYWGGLEEEEISVDRNSPALFKRNFSATLLTLSPKLKFGKDDAFLTFSPMYHIGTINARGDHSTLSDNGRYYILKERQRTSSPVWFWSFSLGFEGLAITEKYWFALFLNYTEISAGDALVKLDFSDYGIDADRENTTTIGFGIRFYFNPFPAEKD